MPSSPGYHRGPLVIPGCVEVVLRWAMANSRFATNVLHAENSFSVGVNEGLCNAIFDFIAADARWTAYALCLNSGTGLQQVKIRNLDVALAPQFESTSTQIIGTGTAGTVPESVALVVTLKSAVAGRTGRGRTYLTGFDTDFVDGNGHATSGLTAAATDFMKCVSDALVASSLDLCVAHREHDEYTSPSTGLTVLASPASTARVEQIIVQDNVFDSQRRRK